MNQTTFKQQAITQPTWTAPTLNTNWANFGGGFQNAGYYKDPQGFVHLRGVVGKSTTVTLGETIFTLPAGYRPTAEIVCAIAGNDAYAEVKIDTSGNVLQSAGATGVGNWYSLDCITFATV